MFRPGKASSYRNAVSQQGVVIAGAAYTADEQTKAAFGKLNPYHHGVLPVLLLIENTTSQVISLKKLRVEYVDYNGRHIENVPSRDVPYLRGPDRPKVKVNPIPNLGRGKKNPLAALEIDTRAFGAKMLPPGDAAHGFFYFQAEHRPGAMLYVTGLADAGTGKELFYFDVRLDAR